MAQPDCPNTDLSNGTIVHSSAAVCLDLDTQRGIEDEDRKEEDEEVELAEEVGEDVLMIARDGEEVGENTEQNEPQEVRIIQMSPQTNGVTNEENREGEILKENCGEEEQHSDKDNQNIEEETNQNEGEGNQEEKSNNRHTMTENPCDLVAVRDGKRQEQLSDKSEDIKKDDGDKHGVRQSFETEDKANEGSERAKENSGEEEECDYEDNQNTNQEEGEGKGEEESNYRHTMIESPCDLQTGIDGEGLEHLSDNSEDKKQDKAKEQDVTEAQLREENISNVDDVVEEKEPGSCRDDADHVHESTVEQELKEGTKFSINEIYKEVLHTEGEVAEMESPLPAVTSDTSKISKQLDDEDNVRQLSTDSDIVPTFTAPTLEVVDSQICQITSWSELTDENDNPRKQPVELDNDTTLDCAEGNVTDEAVKETMNDATLVSDDVPELENEENQEVQLSVVFSEEQSQTDTKSQGTMSTLNNQTFQEEHLQLDDSQMVRDEKNMTEESDAGDVNEALGEGEDNNKEAEKEKNVEIEAHTELPHPVLKCVDEGPSDTQQGTNIDKSREAFELEEVGTRESISPGIEGTIEENQNPAEENSDLEDHALPTLGDEGMPLNTNKTEQQQKEDFPADRTGDNIEDLMAEMEMANEPVTVLDDEFDEQEEFTRAEVGEQKPASVTAELEATTVEVKKQSELQDGNEETYESGKEEIEMNEKLNDSDTDVQFSLTDRVKELKQAMEFGMLNAEPQPPKKEDWRSVRVPPHRRKDDNWIKKEPEEVKEPEVEGWRKEIKPVRKDIWEPEMGQKERSPEKKSLPQKEDWIKELKSVIKHESFPRKGNEQVKKKRVVLLEDGHSYFPRLEQRNETREEVKLISHKKIESPPPLLQDSPESQDQAYEISLYVKVKNKMDQDIQYNKSFQQYCWV